MLAEVPEQGNSKRCANELKSGFDFIDF